MQTEREKLIGRLRSGLEEIEKEGGAYSRSIAAELLKSVAALSSMEAGAKVKTLDDATIDRFWPECRSVSCRAILRAEWAEFHALEPSPASPVTDEMVERIEATVTEVMSSHISPEHDGVMIGEGGCPRIDWYNLRRELVTALKAALRAELEEANRKIHLAKLDIALRDEGLRLAEASLAEVRRGLLDAQEALEALNEWFAQREAGQPTTNSEATMFVRTNYAASLVEAALARLDTPGEEVDGEEAYRT